MYIKLREERIKSGMTQTELAKKAGVSRVTVALIENDYQKNPNTKTLKKLAKALSVNPREFIL